MPADVEPQCIPFGYDRDLGSARVTYTNRKAGARCASAGDGLGPFADRAQHQLRQAQHSTMTHAQTFGVLVIVSDVYFTLMMSPAAKA